eukprot:1153215-Pelagomonas_calceolata.AAC.14
MARGCSRLHVDQVNKFTQVWTEGRDRVRCASYTSPFALKMRLVPEGCCNSRISPHSSDAQPLRAPPLYEPEGGKRKEKHQPVKTC